MTNQMNNQIPRRYLGYFIDGDYKEPIQIEYRYAVGSEFRFYTRIKSQDYRIADGKFFGALAALLDKLPETSAIVLPHQVVALSDISEEIVILEEWLYPYKVRDSDTIVYQLKLLHNSQCIETPRYTDAGYAVTDFGSAAEMLRKRIGKGLQLKICYFCQYLIGEAFYGGTDYRHDQLYCMRDRLEEFDELDKLLNTLPNPKSQRDEILSLLMWCTSNMDALHSCSAFVYREASRFGNQFS